jgi:AraC-like DNA-binding protein
MLTTENSLPLSHWQVLNTNDPSQACMHLSGLFRPHRVITHATGNSINFRHNRIEIGNFSMNALSYGEEVTINAKDNADNYLLKFTLDGSTRVKQLDTSFDTGANSLCVLNPTRPLEDRLSTDCNMLVVQLDGEHVRKMLIDELGCLLNKPLEFLPVCLPLKGTVASYAQIIMTVCDDINRDDSGLSGQLVAQQLEQMLISLLLMELPNTYSDILKQDIYQAPSSVLRCVDSYIDSYFAAQITVKDLAKAAGTSIRTLQKAFYTHKGISPMTYLRDRRLEHARKLLLNIDSNHESITDVALSCGFTHMSRFAQHYKIRFGELPSETGRIKYFIH